MMGLLGKVDGALLAIVGGLGWALQANDSEAGALLLGLVTAVMGVLGVVAAVVIWNIGGHQSPPLAVTVGHLSPSLARAAILIGLAWVGAWAAVEAGAKATGLAVAISVVVFGGVADVIKPIKEKTDELRPVAFGQSAIQHVYGDNFDVDPDSPAIPIVNARSAVHDDPARIHDAAGELVKKIDGWNLVGRQSRLEVIAAAM